MILTSSGIYNNEKNCFYDFKYSPKKNIKFLTGENLEDYTENGLFAWFAYWDSISKDQNINLNYQLSCLKKFPEKIWLGIPNYLSQKEIQKSKNIFGENVYLVSRPVALCKYIIKEKKINKNIKILVLDLSEYICTIDLIDIQKGLKGNDFVPLKEEDDSYLSKESKEQLDVFNKIKTKFDSQLISFQAHLLNVFNEAICRKNFNNKTSIDLKNFIKSGYFAELLRDGKESVFKMMPIMDHNFIEGIFVEITNVVNINNIKKEWLQKIRNILIEFREIKLQSECKLVIVLPDTLESDLEFLQYADHIYFERDVACGIDIIQQCIEKKISSYNINLRLLELEVRNNKTKRKEKIALIKKGQQFDFALSEELVYIDYGLYFSKEINECHIDFFLEGRRYTYLAEFDAKTICDVPIEICCRASVNGGFPDIYYRPQNEKDDQFRLYKGKFSSKDLTEKVATSDATDEANFEYITRESIVEIFNSLSLSGITEKNKNIFLNRINSALVINENQVYKKVISFKEIDFPISKMKGDLTKYYIGNKIPEEVRLFLERKLVIEFAKHLKIHYDLKKEALSIKNTKYHKIEMPLILTKIENNLRNLSYYGCLINDNVWTFYLNEWKESANILYLMFMIKSLANNKVNFLFLYELMFSKINESLNPLNINRLSSILGEFRRLFFCFTDAFNILDETNKLSSFFDFILKIFPLIFKTSNPGISKELIRSISAIIASLIFFENLKEYSSAIDKAKIELKKTKTLISMITINRIGEGDIRDFAIDIVEGRITDSHSTIILNFSPSKEA